MTSLKRAGAGRAFGRVLAGLALLGIGIGAGPADEARLADYFGFLPLEVYKLDSRISGLVVRDFDGDKAEDIAVINNARSRIDLLLSTPAPAADDGEKPKPEVNELTGDRRMRLVSVPVNKEVVSLQAGDFDGDGRVDLAYYGTPAGIEILHNRGGGKFGDAKKINTGEALELAGALSVGDLDRDGRDDLALLTKEEILLVFQREKGKLSEVERRPHTLGNPRMVKIVDMDGNGVADLALLDGGSDDPIRVRFGTEGGKHGPEERFFIEPLRAYAFGQVDGKPGSELVTIEAQSGRTRVLSLGTDDDATRGRLSFYPLPPGGEQGRSLDLGDLDGDGKVDVVATDPSRAQFIVHRQSGQSGLGESKTYPGLVGGGPVKLADLDGDGKAEVYVVSEKEKQLGRSTFQDGRLSFPAPLPTTGGEPVALTVADLDGDKTPEILYVTKDLDPATKNDLFTLRALSREKSGTFVPFRWGPVDSVPLKGIGGVPPALMVVDVNRDNLPDLLVFDVYGPPLLLLGRPGEPPAPAAGGLGPLAGVTPAGLSVARIDGQQALIVAQQSFARKLLLDKGGHWAVQDQFDSGRTSAKIEGAAVIDTDGDGVPEIALLDRASKSILFLAKKDGTYLPSGTLSVGPFDDFKGMHAADLDGDGKDDLLLAGTSRFGVVLTGQKGLKLKTLASYESPRHESRFADLIVADLNADGQPDVALTDVVEHYLEIATFEEKKSDLARAFSFKIFERKNRRTPELEPRDLAVGDVDGDGRTDLVLIAHDRVLVYRQDPGQAKEPVKAADGK